MASAARVHFQPYLSKDAADFHRNQLEELAIQTPDGVDLTVGCARFEYGCDVSRVKLGDFRPSPNPPTTTGPTAPTRSPERGPSRPTPPG